MLQQAGDVSYMAIAPLEPLVEGQQFEVLPAHVTIVPWFTLAQSSDMEDIRHTIQEDLLVEWSMTPLKGIERVLFGPNKNIPATRLGGFAFGALGVHDCMLGILGRIGATLDITYTELNNFSYRPHVTDTPDRAVAVGEHLTLRQLAILRKARGSRVKIVDAVYNWQGYEA